MNTFISFSEGPNGTLARFIKQHRHRSESEETLAYAEMLHDLYCQREHMNDDNINENYCAWLDEEIEDEWFTQWSRTEHNRWLTIVQKVIESGITPETAFENSPVFYKK